MLVASSVGGGGAERQAAILFEQLRENRQCVLISLEDDTSYLDGPMDGLVTLSKGGRGDALRLVLRLRSLLRSDDVVVAFNWYSNLLASLASPRSRRIVRYGAPPECDVPAGLRRAAARWAQRRSFGVVGLTWGMAADACELLGSPLSVCAAIPNAAEHPSPVADAEPPSDPYILVLSRLAHEKGVDRAIRAFALMAPSIPHSMKIVGAGPERVRLETLTHELGIAPRVMFEGYVPSPGNVVAGADLLLVGSRWEGFGSSMIEAMARGVPVVAMDVAYGPREIIRNTGGGILVDDDDVDAFASEARDLLQDRARWAAMSQAARTALDVYGVRPMVQAYLDVIDAAHGALVPDVSAGRVI